MNPYDDDAPTNVQGTPPLSSGQPANPDQKSAITAAVVGTAALGGAAYGMSRFLDDDGAVAQNGDDPSNGNGDNEPNPNPEPNPNSDPNLNSDSNPNPDPNPNSEPHEKTFAEAFGEAREAHGGGGGYFEFDRDGNGKKEYYSTYLDSEWDKLSHHDKQEFYATVPDYHAPSGGGGGGALEGLHPMTAVAHNDVPPSVDDVVVIDDDDVVVEADSDNTHVAQVSDGSTGHDADVVRISGDKGDLYVLDFDHDDNADMMMRPDTHDALIDTDHDGRMDTRVEYGQDTHAESLRETIPAVSMQSLYSEVEPTQEPEPDDSIHLADNSGFGLDFDNNADTSDLDYDYTT